MLQLDQDSPDLRAAVAIAEALLADERLDPESEKATAAKALLKFVDSRTWKGRPLDGNNGPLPVRLVKGKLVALSEIARVHRTTDTVEVRPANGRMPPVRFLRQSLDDKSRQYLQEAEKAVFDLSEVLLAEERTALKAKPLAEQDVRFESVEVHGITLVPRVEFADGRLCRVTLSTPGSDNPLTHANPRLVSMFGTLQDALTEKYGPPSEEGATDFGERAVWRLQKTMVSLTRHRLGLGISYSAPDPKDRSAAEKL
jgi:hypothetical protein